MNAPRRTMCLLLKSICLHWQTVLAFVRGKLVSSFSQVDLHIINTFHKACHAVLVHLKNTSYLSDPHAMEGVGNVMFYSEELAGALDFVSSLSIALHTISRILLVTARRLHLYVRRLLEYC